MENENVFGIWDKKVEAVIEVCKEHYPELATMNKEFWGKQPCVVINLILKLAGKG